MRDADLDTLAQMALDVLMALGWRARWNEQPGPDADPPFAALVEVQHEVIRARPDRD